MTNAHKPSPPASPVDIFVQQQRRKAVLGEKAPNWLRYRMRAGLILGLVLGLGYGLAAQNVNEIFNPGLPLAHEPFGRLGNMVAPILAGLLLGACAALPRNAINGISLASLVFAGLVMLRGIFFTGVQNMFGLDTTFFYTGFAVGSLVVWTVLGLLPVGLLRWAIDDQREQSDRPWRSPVRWRMPAAVLGLALLAGATTSLYPAEALLPLKWMNAVVQQGRQAAAASTELPPLLRDVDGFAAHAAQSYQVALDDDLAIKHDISDLAKGLDTLTTARFADGWMLACLQPFSGAAPRCKGYAPGVRSK